MLPVDREPPSDAPVSPPPLFVPRAGQSSRRNAATPASPRDPERPALAKEGQRGFRRATLPSRLSRASSLCHHAAPAGVPDAALYPTSEKVAASPAVGTADLFQQPENAGRTRQGGVPEREVGHCLSYTASAAGMHQALPQGHLPWDCVVILCMQCPQFAMRKGPPCAAGSSARLHRFLRVTQ